MNFYSSRKGLAEVALDVPLNTNLQSQEKVTPSTVWLSPLGAGSQSALVSSRLLLLGLLPLPLFWGKNRTSTNVYQLQMLF